MNSPATLFRERESAPPLPWASARVMPINDDAAMLREAATLTRELNTPRPAIYWSDLLGSSAVGYTALAAALVTPSTLMAVAAALVAVLALYRAGSFIHELTHLKRGSVPGFRLAWNLLIGVPLLVPSFLYEGVHNQHHAKRYYGTADDPEYLPLAQMRPWTLPLFLIAAAMAPIFVLIRFAILAPSSTLSSGLRKVVVARYSGLQINPGFRRPAPEAAFRRDWAVQEIACSVWAIVLLTLVASGLVPVRETLILLVVASGAMLLNQIRTLVAHLWENEGEPMSVTDQYRDSVNVPPPATMPVLWAPVGLRYHALHHLLPGLPYHALGEAHRRLSRELATDSVYHNASHPGLVDLVSKLAASSWRWRRTA